jgi:hypothetical protein
LLEIKFLIMKKLFLSLIILFQICLVVNSQVDLKEGLYAHYPFNGNLNDKSGSGYDLIAKGGNFSTGRFGNISAYKFNGTSDYLVSDNSLNLGLFTISIWVNINEFPTNNQSQRCRFLGISEELFSINCLKDSIGIHVYDNWNITNSNYKFQLHKWYHIVVVRSDEYFYLYINDTLSSYAIDPNPFTILYGGFFDGRLSMGSEQNAYISDQGMTSYPDWASFFNGKIDDVRIYNRALNEQEIHALYNLPEEVDPVITNGSNISICSGHSSILRANSDSNYTYQWLKDETEIISATSDTLVITEPGEYRVKETDIYGNSDISSPAIVNNFTVFVKDTTIQCGSTSQLNAFTNYTGNESLIYLWSPAEGLNSSNIANPVADIINTKTYSVTIKTPGGCFAKDSLTVIVEPLIVYARDTTIICGTDAQLKVTTNYTGTDVLFYNWTPAENLNDSHIRNPIALNPKPSIYSVEVSTSKGCFTSKTIALNSSNDLKPSNGLFANYPFKRNVNDQSGNDHDLIASGGGYSTDRFGNISAYEFNGTTDYLVSDTIFNFPIPFFPQSPSSVSFWVNIREFPLNNPDQESVFWWVGRTGIDCRKDTIVVTDHALKRNITHSKYKLQLNKWYHVIFTTSQNVYISPVLRCTFISDYSKLYINDTLRSDGYHNFSVFCYGSDPTYSSSGYSGYLQLGSMKYSDSTERTNFFNGKIDDVMFYNSTLSTQDIHALYMDKTSSDLHPSICMVSVNESDRNIVTWQKYRNSGIDSTYIYREWPLQTGQYELIGKVPYSLPGIFIDSASNAGIRSNKYMIAYKDFCGYESEKSPEHKTMHLTINKGIGFNWNLIWEQYLGIPVQSYGIYRGISKSDLTFIGSTSGSSSSYTDVDAPSGIVYYQVKIDLPQDCSDLKPAEFASSGSNIVNTWTNKDLDNTIFYPNPADNVIYIRRCDSTESFIFIFNLDGKLLLSKQLTNDGNSMDISGLSPGAYLVKFVDSGRSLINKLIKK